MYLPRVKAFTCDKLKISNEVVNKMYFIKCHRMSKFKFRDNPIVIQLLHSAGRMLIFESMNNLMEANFSTVHV